MRQWSDRWRTNRRGSVILEATFVMPLLVFLLVSAMDVARALHTGVTVVNAATAGAMYGSQNVTKSSDTAGIVSAAMQEAEALDSLSVNAQQYCQCGTGSESACSGLTCTGGTVKRTFIRVTVSTNFTTMVPYPRLPHSIEISQTAVMRVD